MKKVLCLMVMLFSLGLFTTANAYASQQPPWSTSTVQLSFDNPPPPDDPPPPPPPPHKHRRPLPPPPPPDDPPPPPDRFW
ncbi:MAG: hypothetical protein H6Q74_2877 [Firmicutes bacterium]|nr:hypothetical protein [Bacillota bacterium]